MVNFLKKVFGGSEKKTALQEQQLAEEGTVSEKRGPLEVPGLSEVIRYFPLGEKIRYYPEYQKEGALDTIVLGYGVNDQFIYSAIDIRCQQESERDVFALTMDGEERLVNEINRFCLLIPFNRDDENKRDYVRRAELGPQGPFRRHNVITLMACSTGGILSTIDTVVRKIQPLKNGIYAGHDVVLLDVMPRSLKLTDQRRHYRLQTALPAMLAIKDADTHACTLLDFSEESAQVQFPEPSKELAALTEFRRLTLLFDVSNGSQAKQYALAGVMYRKTQTCLVIELQGIYKNGKVESLGLVDILNIKASLLQHPATQQVLAEQRGG